MPSRTQAQPKLNEDRTLPAVRTPIPRTALKTTAAMTIPRAMTMTIPTGMTTTIPRATTRTTTTTSALTRTTVSPG